MNQISESFPLLPVNHILILSCQLGKNPKTPVANKGLNFNPLLFFFQVEGGFIAHLGVVSSAGGHTLPETGMSVDRGANSSTATAQDLLKTANQGSVCLVLLRG